MVKQLSRTEMFEASLYQRMGGGAMVLHGRVIAAMTAEGVVIVPAAPSAATAAAVVVAVAAAVAVA